MREELGGVVHGLQIGWLFFLPSPFLIMSGAGCEEERKEDRKEKRKEDSKKTTDTFPFSLFMFR